MTELKKEQFNTLYEVVKQE